MKNYYDCGCYNNGTTFSHDKYDYDEYYEDGRDCGCDHDDDNYGSLGESSNCHCAKVYTEHGCGKKPHMCHEEDRDESEWRCTCKCKIYIPPFPFRCK